VLLLAWQTSAVAAQARIANKVAGASALREAARHLHDVYQIFIEEPELKAYFYNGAQLPTNPQERAKVETIAEMFADVLESTIYASTSLPAFSCHYNDWINYSQFLLARSPAMKTLVIENSWHPLLRELT
jgi:hypothetical protein